MTHKHDAVEQDDRIFRARMMHEIYELLAPEFGYETRDDTKDFDPDSPNGKLMIEVVHRFTEAEFGRLTAELDALRQFVGAMSRVAIEEWHGVWSYDGDGGHFTFFDSNGTVAAIGTDPFDAWQKLQGESK